MITMTQDSESKNDNHPQPEDDYTDALTTLQNELATLKQAFESQKQEYQDTITKLQQENTSLQRSLIRNALTPEQPAPQPKTEEELYNENIQQLADKTLLYMAQL